MTKQQILKLTGLSEAEFYKKYPTKEAFYKAYPNAKKQMASGGRLDLNKDRMRSSTGNPVGADDYILPTLYGIGEGALGTFVPQAAPLANIAYQGFQSIGDPTEEEKKVQNMMRGFGKLGGAGMSVAIDPSKFKSGIATGISGLGEGVGNAVRDPRTGQIISGISSSLTPFINLIPDQKEFGGRMKFARGGDMMAGTNMGSPSSSGSSLSSPGVSAASLNADKMKRNKTYLGGAAGVFAGMAAGLGDIIGLGPMIDKVNESEGIETSKEFDISRSVNAAVGGAAAGFFGVGKGASAGEDAFKKAPSQARMNRESAKNARQADNILNQRFSQPGGVDAGPTFGPVNQPTSYVDIPGNNLTTGVNLARFGGMYRDGGPINNSGNLGLTDLQGPSHADGGITLNEDVEVEGKETIYTPERYVFSEVMKASKNALKEAGLSPSYAGKSYSSISRSFKNSIDTLRGSEDKLAQRAVDQKLKKLIDAHEVDREMKRQREARNVVASTTEEKAGGYNMFPNAESIMFPGQGQATVVPADNQMPIEVTGADGSQQILTNSPIQTQAPFMERKMSTGGMLKRADGSYSRRGLWDNIRAKAAANRKAGKKGKKPTKEMLEQEAKIRAAEKAMGGYYYAQGGYFKGDGSDQEDGSFWRSNDDRSYMYGGDMMKYPKPMNQGGLMYQQDMGYLPEIEDAGNYVYDEKLKADIWVPDWNTMEEKAKNLKATKVRTKSGSILNFDKQGKAKSVIGKAEGGKLPKGILKARLESHMSPSEVDNYMESYAYGGDLGKPNYEMYVNSPSYYRADGGSFDNPGFRALPKKVQEKIKSNMAYGGMYQDGGAYMEDDMYDMEEMDMNEPTEFKEGGGYRVYRTRERKGKTHKVVGPGGKVKYFGDPNLGERSKSKYGKKAFYARHRKNLAKNPFFRAYARATWQDGGYITLSPQGLEFSPTIKKATGGEFGSPDNNYYYGDANGSYLTAMNYGGMYADGVMVANPTADDGGANEQMKKIMTAVVQMLQEGNQPTEVVKALVQQGLPEEAAGQIVGSIMREMQGSAEGAMTEQMPINQGMPMAQGGMMPSGEQGQMEQLMMAVMQMLQQTKDPMAVVKALVQKGMSQEQAGQIVKAVMQDMQAAASEAKASGTLGQPQAAPQMGAPMMEMGGMMEYKAGGIHIDPSKRGTFTAAASKHGMGVQEFARKVLSAPEGKYSPAMRKKANFARNASKWKHAMGGRMMYAQNLGYISDANNTDTDPPTIDGEIEVEDYRSPMAPYIIGGAASAIGPMANIIAAGAVPDPTYISPAEFEQVGYTPVSTARQQANQAIAANRDAMRLGAPTQASYLGNLAVSLPSTASALGNLLAQTRFGIDAANIDIANKEALNRQSVAQQNALLKDQSIAQRWNLGLAGAEGIGENLGDFSLSLEKKRIKDEEMRNLFTDDFSSLSIVKGKGKKGKYRFVPNYFGQPIYKDKEGNLLYKQGDKTFKVKIKN